MGMNNNLMTDAELARLEPVVAELEKKWDEEKAEKEKILLADLKRLRRSIAREIDAEEGLIFRNSVLVEMVKQMPKNKKELLAINGVNLLRATVFGPKFLSELWY